MILVVKYFAEPDFLGQTGTFLLIEINNNIIKMGRLVFVGD